MASIALAPQEEKKSLAMKAVKWWSRSTHNERFNPSIIRYIETNDRLIALYIQLQTNDAELQM